MDSWGLLVEIVLLLSFCLVLGGVFSRLRQSPLIGYLIAGMLLGGPGGFHIVRAEGHIEAIAEVGVALLMFGVGLEFSFSRLRKFGAKTFVAGVIQVILTGIIAAFVGGVFRLRIVEAVALGAMVSMTSTSVMLRVLMDRAEIDSLHGRNSLAISLVQDIAVVPLAILMTLLAGEGNPSEIATGIAKTLLLAAGLIVLLYLLVNQLAVRALRTLTVEKNRELTVLLAVVVGLGSTWAAHKAGLSSALGAFLAGMFLGSSPFATQVRADVASLRVVLLTLFFGAVGMVANPVWILQNFGLVIAITALIIAGKAIIVWLILRFLGLPGNVAFVTGLCVAQVGEFAFVLGSVGRASGVVSDPIYMLVVSSSILSFLLTPWLISAAPAVAAFMQRMLGAAPMLPETPPSESETPPEVIIVGFGPAGQAVGRTLLSQNRSVLVIDLNPEGRKIAESMGFQGQIGDATLIDVLQHTRIDAAQVVVVTLPERAAALTVLEHVRGLAPTAHVLVRSRHQIHKDDFETAGAHVVIGDEEEVGRSLAEHVSAHLAGGKEQS